MSLYHISTQIIAISHDLTPNGGVVGEPPQQLALLPGNQGWWNITIRPDLSSTKYWLSCLKLKIFNKVQTEFKLNNPENQFKHDYCILL